LRDHADAVEADLQHYYHVDLADLWRSGLSVRRLSVLISGLPQDSLTASAVSGIPREWSRIEPWLLDYMIQYLTGEPHPARPKPIASADEKTNRVQALLDHQKRMAERDAILAQNP
jgi:hypothetical protein